MFELLKIENSYKKVGDIFKVAILSSKLKHVYAGAKARNYGKFKLCNRIFLTLLTLQQM